MPRLRASVMEGPFRDLGSGFARLMGPEGARRGPSPITHVEDALLELLRNARDAGAARVFVASTLTGRRFRTLTVIDDGPGIPEAFTALVFEAGVTTRHLAPIPASAPTGVRHGAGLALYHIKQAAVSAEVLSPSAPTALRATFDTRTLPERTLQSASRPSNSNLLATARSFAHPRKQQPPPAVYYGPPARILAALVRNRIIQPDESGEELQRLASRVGLDLSLRTAQRVMRGSVAPVRPVSSGDVAGGTVVSRSGKRSGKGAGGGGVVLPVGKEERAEIAAILGRAARAGYMEVDDLKVESRPGEILLRARVYEPEEEYE